jgi:hypothetical protein
MADVSDETHGHIVAAIRDALADLGALQRSTETKPGYVGFLQVESTLMRCHEAISGERDQARIVTKLRIAAGSIALVGSGEVQPAVERTREKFWAILAELESKNTNGFPTPRFRAGSPSSQTCPSV